MSGVRDGVAGRESLRGDAAPTWCPVPAPSTAGEPHREPGLVELHESIATLLASRGQWRQAYQHLRSALELMSTQDAPRIPEQLRHEVDRLRKEHAEAREQSMRDSLTASYNRRYLDEHLTALLANSSTNTGLGVALVDLDWFKRVNDTYGHILGDRVLQRVVELLQEVLPQNAFCARYGGEEFVLVLPAIDPQEAATVCETARRRVELFPWSQMAPRLEVTVSIGLAHEHSPVRRSPTAAAEQQLLNADVLLYAAKQSGRNAVAYRIGTEVRVAGFTPDRRPAVASP